jgi:rubredoxin
MDARGVNGPDAGIERMPRYECGVCWQVYDPAIGDPSWQVAAGTAFAALPAHWSCPVCASERDRFLELHDA